MINHEYTQINGSLQKLQGKRKKGKKKAEMDKAKCIQGLNNATIKI